MNFFHHLSHLGEGLLATQLTQLAPHYLDSTHCTGHTGLLQVKGYATAIRVHLYKAELPA